MPLKTSSETPTFRDPFQTMLWHANPLPTTVFVDSDTHFFRIHQSHQRFMTKIQDFGSSDPLVTPSAMSQTPLGAHFSVVFIECVFQRRLRVDSQVIFLICFSRTFILMHMYRVRRGSQFVRRLVPPQGTYPSAPTGPKVPLRVPDHRPGVGLSAPERSRAP